MKFSYAILKKLSGKLPEMSKFVEKFNLHAFEAESAGEDTIEIAIPANRYSDAASHWGIARIAAGIFNGQARDLAKGKDLKAERKGTAPEVKIMAKHSCRRYAARYFEISKATQTPQWIREALMACGLRPINTVVDIMNYVMLETGQPLHAFDAEKIDGPLEVRMARKGEEMHTLDGNSYVLGAADLVIADNKGPLAIAGIKGGKRAEIALYSKKIVVEAANFDGIGIYKTARSLNLFTDASSRFSHGLSPLLVGVAMRRVTELLKEVCKAKIGEVSDIDFTKHPKIVFKFDIQEFNRLTGLELKEKAALDYLKRAGFSVKGKLVEVPPLRNDVSGHADLAEEIVNLIGYDKIPETAPRVALAPATRQDSVNLKDQVRAVLRGFGLSETYNHSFVSRKDLTDHADPKWWGAVPLRNPVSSDHQYLRPSLAIRLLKNLEDNFRFYDEVRVFEIGNVFVERDEKLAEDEMLGLAIGFKKGSPVLELKGLVDQLLSELGLIDYFFRDLNWDLKQLDQAQSLRIEVDHHVVGYIGIPKGQGNLALAELDLGKLLKLVQEEKEYEPVSKYPSIVRDLSVFVSGDIRVDELMAAMEGAAPQYLDDTDLLDYYEDPKQKDGRKSLTFRLVFLADDRTLTDEEIGKEMEKIISVLQDRFNAEIR